MWTAPFSPGLSHLLLRSVFRVEGTGNREQRWGAERELARSRKKDIWSEGREKLVHRKLSIFQIAGESFYQKCH